MLTNKKKRGRKPVRIVMTKEMVQIIPTTPDIDANPSAQDMIIKNCDFGPSGGIRNGISTRNLMILLRAPKNMLRSIDKGRIKQNLPPIFFTEEDE
jgi:hypothetical protein